VLICTFFQIEDLRFTISKAVNSGNYSANFESMIKAVKPQLQLLEKFQTKKSKKHKDHDKEHEVETPKNWVLDYITFTDFFAYEPYQVLFRLRGELFKDFPNLTAFMKDFEALPKIKQYFDSPRYIAAISRPDPKGAGGKIVTI